ncbi:MAG: pantoate--beta-alanine ligase [Candidatus Saganbacteria bacterium]|nr:pantoate--beta-alanine ligase [Candidatus Saganbacteria bacterium]
MKIIKYPRQMHAFAEQQKAANRTIGFVPTMGYLHEGHLSLIESASAQSDVVIVSIFVNPLQFGPKEDLKRYPRDLGRDKKLLRNFDIAALFVPTVGQMYPEKPLTFVEVPDLGQKLCGRTRPGHFRGVATVVNKFFNIVAPDLAFFGEKDFQQLTIIKRMVADLNLPVRIVGCPTVREPDGVAMSSRNAYLLKEERAQAVALYQTLRLAAAEIRHGIKQVAALKQRLRRFLRGFPKVRLDYLEVVDPVSLEPKSSLKGESLIAVAAYLGQTRLIDNCLVGRR